MKRRNYTTEIFGTFKDGDNKWVAVKRYKFDNLETSSLRYFSLVEFCQDVFHFCVLLNFPFSGIFQFQFIPHDHELILTSISSSTSMFSSTAGRVLVPSWAADNGGFNCEELVASILAWERDVSWISGQPMSWTRWGWARTNSWAEWRLILTNSWMKCGWAGPSSWKRRATGGLRGMTRWDESSLKASQTARRATGNREEKKSIRLTVITLKNIYFISLNQPIKLYLYITFQANQCASKCFTWRSSEMSKLIKYIRKGTVTENKSNVNNKLRSLK